MPLSLPAWSKTLKCKIVAITTIAAVLSTTGATQFVSLTTQADVERMLMQSQRRDREHTAALLASKVETLQSLLSAVVRKLPPPAWQDPAALERYLLDKPGVNELFESVLAARGDGTTIVRLARGQAQSEMVNIADREYFQRAMHGDQPVISKPLIGRISKTPLLVIAVPVLAGDGRAVGVIGGTIALQSSRLFSGLGAGAADGRTFELVVDRDGVMLAHSDPTRLLRRAADEPGLAQRVADWLASGSPIDTEGQASLSNGYLVSSSGIALTDWMLMRVTPAEQALQPIIAAQRTAWIASAVLGLLAALLAGALAWAMLRPISALRQRVQLMLDEKDTAGTPWPRSGGEVGALSGAFQRLVEQAENRQAEARELLARLEAVMNHAEIGIAMSRIGKFELVSGTFCRIFDCDKEDLIGQSTRSIHVSDATYQALSDRARPAIMAHGAFNGELELMRRNGEVFWAHMRGRAVGPGDRTMGTIWIVEDVTQAREQREHLAWTADHDALTRLMNRRAFEAALGMATSHATSQTFCALFIDLDRFKQVNDRGGHAAGDALLRDVAKLLAAQVRKSDIVARLGGDEFAVLLDACPLVQAQSIAEKLRAAVIDYRLDWEGGHRFSVGASIGLLCVDGQFANAAEALRAADAACYAAKREGRNRVAVYEPGMTASRPTGMTAPEPLGEPSEMLPA